MWVPINDKAKNSNSKQNERIITINKQKTKQKESNKIWLSKVKKWHCWGSWWYTARMDTVGVCDGVLLVRKLLWFGMVCCLYGHCWGSSYYAVRMDTAGVFDGVLLVWSLLWFVMVCCSYGQCWGSWWYTARVGTVWYAARMDTVGVFDSMLLVWALYGMLLVWTLLGFVMVCCSCEHVESAHSKLHEMYSQGNPLPKSIQTIFPEIGSICFEINYSKYNAFCCQ